MIVIVHDSAHKAVSKTNFDFILMNFGSAMVFLPFYGELFRHYHLIHHAHTNSVNDPLWPSQKERVFRKSRLLFFFSELIPVLSTIVLLMLGHKVRKQNIKGPAINIKAILVATLFSALLFYLLRPSVLFLILTLFLTSIIAKIRHWCEHTGIDQTKASNTYWFPFGMGIGNHECHHYYPGMSWISNQIVLIGKKKDTNPALAIYRLLYNKQAKHYTLKN